MQISRDVARRFKGAINSLWTATSCSTTDKRSAQGRSLARYAAAVLCFAVLLFATHAQAQTAGTGSIQGTVTDPNGAVIPNAVVTLTEQSTQVTLTTKTTSGGEYAFPNINVGTYTVNVTAQGFDTYSALGNVLEVGSSISINPKLTVGSADTKIEVHSDNLALQTEDVTYKQTVDAQEITELPLNGRQITDLMQVAGATVVAGGADFAAPNSKYSYASVSYAVAGGFGNSVEWRLDGASNDDYMAGSNLPFPFPDALSQFSVETAALGAQASSSKSSGLVNVVTKSGTNRFHGDVFEFIRNNFIDATAFFAQPCVNGTRPPNCGKDTLHKDQYGGTIGGPIKKDKLFAFGGFQYTRSKEASANTTANLPTAANILQGDYTQQAGTPGGAAPNPLCTSNKVPTQLLDPLTGNIIPNNIYASVPTWNPTSLNVLKYLPYTSTTGSTAYTLPTLSDGSQVCGHAQYSIPKYSFDKQFVTRVDYQINGSNHFYGRYLFDSYQLPGFYSPTNILLTTQAATPEQRVQTFTMGEDHTFSANFVNSAHVAILRRFTHRLYAPGVPTACDPSIGVAITCGSNTGFQLTTAGFSAGSGSSATAFFNDNTLAINDDVTYLHGKHQIVFGGEFVRNQLNINNCFQCLGSFNFGTNFSQYGPYGSKTQAALNPNVNNGNTYGVGALDFLQGAMNTNGFTEGKYQQNALRSNYPSLYVQDTYHATPRLTVVAGVRWQPFYVPVDTKNRGAVFNMANFMAGVATKQYCQPTQTPCTNGAPAPANPGPPAGIMFYGDPGVSRTFTNSSPYEFEPNFGVTYDVSGNGKTVVRAGVQYSYDIPNNFTLQRNQDNPPFATSVQQVLKTYVPFSTPWTPPTTLPSNSGPGPVVTGVSTTSNPFPTPSTLQGLSTVSFPNNAQYIVPNSHFRPAQYTQYTASLQQQFPRGWTLNLQYIGNTGHHEIWGTRLNPALYIPNVSSGIAGPSNCNININGTNYYLGEFPASNPVPKAGTACSTTGNESDRSKLVLINPAEGGKIGTVNSSLIANDIASSNYNGLVVSVNHRLSNTFSVLANYTWSKCMDEIDEGGDLAGASGENNDNPSLDYGPCGFDFRNVAGIDIILKSAFHFDNHLESEILNGWEVSTTTVLSSGSPYSITLGKDEDLVGNPGGDRASLIPGVAFHNNTPIRQGSGLANRQYINFAAILNPTNPDAYLTPSTSGAPVYGNTSRNQFTGPAAITVNAQLSRFWKLHEGLNLTTRIEAFNALNHPIFANPDSNLNSSNKTFAQITGTTSAYSARVFQGSARITF